MARFFCIFHALSFELNFFQPEVPFKDFEFQPVKARKADLTDTGPGDEIAVSNTDVKYRDVELAIIQNSDYRVRFHRER